MSENIAYCVALKKKFPITQNLKVVKKTGKRGIITFIQGNNPNAISKVTGKPIKLSVIKSNVAKKCKKVDTKCKKRHKEKGIKAKCPNKTVRNGITGKCTKNVHWKKDFIEEYTL